MYLQRKIDKWLLDWKNNKNKYPALIFGIRQCGKTESIRHFGNTYYKNIIELNFWTHAELIDIFSKSLDVDTIVSNISLKFPDIIIEPGQTLLFFDEIQDCPRARLCFKEFAQDGRYDVIGSGSYLGINGYIIGDATPVPIGYEDNYHMNTMDFEEFMWANKIPEKNLIILENCLKNYDPVSEFMDQYFKEMYNTYLCVGGFPQAVNSYLERKNIMDAARVVQKIVDDIKGDFGRRKDKMGKPLFKVHEVARIQEAFSLIPTFLSKENKRYMPSKINGGSSQEKVDSIEYLTQAHIVEKVYNLENISLPLDGNKIFNQYKIFPTDISLATSMYGIDTLSAIMSGNLGQNGGALYEAAVFDSLYKASFNTFYFSKNSGLEIDFIISYKGSSTLIEAKKKTGNTKSSKTVMAHPEHYGSCKLIKIGDYNVGLSGDITTIPHYMVYLLGKSRDFWCQDILNKKGL